jgi:mRNA interferase MazF
VIVSNNASNAALNRVQVAPLTSNTGRVYPCEAVVAVGEKSSKVMADQLTTVSKLRLKARLGALSAKDMRAVEQAIMTQLGLPL